VNDCIRNNWASPYSAIGFMIFVIFNNREYMVWQIIEKNRINSLIINVLIFFLIIFGFQLIPISFSVNFLLNYFHDFCNTNRLFSDHDTKLFGYLVLVLCVISKTAMFKYFVVILIAKLNVRSNIIRSVLLYWF
jgi:hypothetical protein